MRIRKVQPDDADALSAIYNHYILNSQATFEESPVSADEMKRRILNIRSRYPWLIAEAEEEIVGYTYATSWKERTAYRYTAETAIYVAQQHTGNKIGSALMESLLEELRLTKIHCLIAGITLPNPESIFLHEKFGFQKAGQIREAGYKFGRRIDVGYWQLLLQH